MNVESGLSAKLILLRNKKGITQKELAQIINYSDKVISKWERGESLPDIIALHQIARFYNVNLDYFVSEDNDFQQIDTQEINEIPLKKIKGPSLLLKWSILPFCVMFIISIFISIEVFIIYSIVFALLIFIYAFLLSNCVWMGMYRGKEIKIINHPTKSLMLVNDRLVDEVHTLFALGVNLNTLIENHEIKAIISSAFSISCKVIVKNVS